MMQLPKKVRLAKFQPFLKASVFSTVGATLTKQIILRLQHLKKKSEVNALLQMHDASFLCKILRKTIKNINSFPFNNL